MGELLPLPSAAQGPPNDGGTPSSCGSPGAAAEEEGWILSYVYDPKHNLSDVVTIDAQTITTLMNAGAAAKAEPR